MAAKRIPATMAMQTSPEPMNASPFHSKVKVSLTLSDPVFVAGDVISGKMEMECRADTGLGIGIMMVELFAVQELTSRDHSATSTFLHSRRLFQGPGLPPSNAVLPHPIPGNPPLPQHYHQARRGQTTFFFRIPTPITSPSTINFGNGLACVRYEVKCTVGVAWKGEKKLVTDKKNVDVVESYEEDDFARIDPEGIIVGENGKIWVQGKVVGGLVVAGDSACVELQVKNHSSKKTTGLQISLTRSLHLGNMPKSEKAPLQITDTLTTVAFRGAEYIVQPGAEGVASLVFDVPRHARSVKGGPRDGDEDGHVTDCLFEVKCTLGIKIGMPLGSKDIQLDLPITILHPLALPQLPVTPERFTSPNPYASPGHMSPPLATSPPHPYLGRAQSPYAYPYPALPLSPPLQPQYPVHTGQGHMQLPSPHAHTPHPYQYFSPPLTGQEYYFPPPPQAFYVPPPRPSSTEPPASQALHELPSGIPDSIDHQYQRQHQMLPLDPAPERPVTPEEGKGERASRIANHLRLSSRHRSVSPQSHRFPLPVANPVSVPGTIMRNLPPPPPSQGPLHLSLANLSASQPGEEAVVVHSPRPMLSPKHSFAIDPVMHNSLTKSERVEELERMAEEGGHQKKDDSRIDIDKTLPSPPISPNKINLLSPHTGTNRPRVDAVFGADTRQPAPANKAPPTPMLTAVTPVRLPRTDVGLGATMGQGKIESGLDALERKLLAEVGTRKLDKDDRRADVRTVMPIAIPSPALEPLNDSAISSLTLADHERDHDGDSDERTHQPGKHSPSEIGRDVGGRRRKAKATTVGEGSGHGKNKDGERRTGKKRERTRDGEAHRRRKSAKGRVAAWLGGIDPEVPPPVDGSPLLLPTVTAAGPSDMKTTAEVRVANITSEKETSSAPNPRSSGFVPIVTSNDEERRRSGIKERPHYKDGMGSPSTSPLTRESQSAQVDGPSSPPSDALTANAENPRPAPRTPNERPEIISPKVSPRLPTFPPAPDSAVKYDIRSARGGRGGRVTAVASIWASQTSENANSKATPAGPKLRNGLPTMPPSKPAKTPPKVSQSPVSASAAPDTSLADLTARRARLVKSQSVPATISSSHAKPMLSSTASLARSTPLPDKRKTPIKLPPTISESQPEMSQPALRTTTVGSPQTTGGDLAFGQARLRDLIKKYQGQSTS